MHRILATALLASALPLFADTAEVEKHVRAGDYAQALAAVDAGDSSPEAMYWKGRACVGLSRLLEATNAFSKVPDGHPLYPYAAKGIIYCAWETDYINFVEGVAPLTISPNEEISALATAALAEFQLRHTQGGDTAPLDELRRLARKHPEWQPALHLLEVEDLRRRSEFGKAISLCREIEADNSLDLAMRHRARLALAEVYYDKEAAEADKPIDEQNDEVDDAGMGEETLLQFISANPESPLLREAFRRLATHNAFISSKYATRRLREWVQDTAKPKRAALALLMQQRAAFAGNADAPGATLANTATAIISEPAARIVILEHVRALLEQGKNDQAELFLSLVPEDPNPYRQFYRAATLPAESRQALETYLLCAKTAPGTLLAVAYSNALFCAYKQGDSAEVQKLMQAEDFPRHVRRALLLTHAKLVQHTSPEIALQNLDSLTELKPTDKQKAEARLLRAGITMQSDPPGTLATLLETLESELVAWSDDQLRRFYRLQLEAVDTLTDHSAPLGIERAEKILAACKRPAVTEEILLNLAERLSAAGNHARALACLQRLAHLAKTQETKARALLLAAEEAAKIGNQRALAQSIALFEQCSRIPSPYADRADIHRARVLVWVNRTNDARQLLSSVLRREASMSPHDLALAYTAMAESFSLDGSKESNLSAMEYCGKLLQLPGLSPEWIARGRLQYASICSRCGQNDKALDSYLQVLDSMPPDPAQFTRGQWLVLDYAVAGAVFQHMQLKQYDKAAALAERAAKAFDHHPVKDTAAGRKRIYSDWAAYIHRNCY